jgi:very-long-chain (3R)-3-hydroxyacyl-CoA dehydratase
MGLKDGYLILYNFSCCIGWAAVWGLSVLSLASNVPKLGVIDAFANVYNDDEYGSLLATILTVAQVAALLEIVHAAIGFVRSPVAVTFMQVMSRIVALFAIYFSPNAQSK